MNCLPLAFPLSNISSSFSSVAIRVINFDPFKIDWSIFFPEKIKKTLTQLRNTVTLVIVKLSTTGFSSIFLGIDDILKMLYFQKLFEKFILGQIYLQSNLVQKNLYLLIIFQTNQPVIKFQKWKIPSTRLSQILLGVVSMTISDSLFKASMRSSSVQFSLFSFTQISSFLMKKPIAVNISFVSIFLHFMYARIVSSLLAL